MRIIKFAFVACFVFNQVICSAQMDQLTRCVVFLTDTVPVTENVNGTNCEVWLRNPVNGGVTKKLNRISGTGFIVYNGSLSFLITAKHVAKEMTPNCQICMADDQGKPMVFTLAAITGQPTIPWFDDSNADLSVYPFASITVQGRKALERRALPFSLLCTNQTAPSRDEMLTTIGFPLALGIDTTFSPLTRESKVSSGMLRDNNGAFFLMQDPSVNGYSGAPLFETGDTRLQGDAFISGGIRCYGIVSGTYSDETGGKMSKIIPAFYACDVIGRIESSVQFVTKPAPK